jgi:hypothetical protein
MAVVRRSSRQGRARPDIRCTKPLWSWTGYGEVMRLTQGSPPALVPRLSSGIIKPNRRGEPEAGQGVEGGRFTDSTDDLGPMKPGNRVEDKILRTGKTWRL